MSVTLWLPEPEGVNDSAGARGVDDEAMDGLMDVGGEKKVAVELDEPMSLGDAAAVAVREPVPDLVSATDTPALKEGLGDFAA